PPAPPLFPYTTLFRSVAALLAGCGDGTSPTPKNSGAGKAKAPVTEDPAVKANLAKLSDEDRKLAEAQKYCVIEQENLLGSMGPPDRKSTRLNSSHRTT